MSLNHFSKNILIILSYLIAISASSCRVAGINIVGEYECKKPLKLASCRIKLNENNTFEYTYNAGDLYQTKSTGNWSLSADKKHIILNSEIRSNSDLISVKEYQNDSLSAGVKKIAIYDSSGNPFSAYIKVNPLMLPINFSDTDNIYGIKYFYVEKIKKIALTFIDAGSKVIFYELRNPGVNELIIHLKLPSGEKYRYFDSSKWLIKKNKLIDTDKEDNGSDKEVYYKR